MVQPTHNKKLVVDGYIEAHGLLPASNLLIRTNPNDTQTFQTQGAVGKWVFANNDGGGFFGIGTEQPAAKLDVVKTSAGDGSYVYPSGNWAARILNRIDDPSQNGLIVANRWAAAASTIFAVGNMYEYGAGFRTFFNVNGSGNVGIGTNAPAERLHVIGNLLLNGSMLVRGGGQLELQFRNSDSAPDQRFSEIIEQNGNITFHTVNDAYSAASNWMEVRRSSGSYAVQSVAFPGNVGIGTADPTHKLAVNGTIKSKEVIVETTGWSDYVFADNYSLQPLSEVEAHIKTNKHLPGIPSATQVAEQGVSIGDMQAKLLAKIEELTLHLIAQEKLLKAQAAALKTQTNQLTAQAEELTVLRSEVRISRR